jgi:ankyrin repeat protein
MDKKSRRAMTRALEELDSGDDAYKIAYEKAMHRIHGQTDDQRQLATQVLSWITFAKRPLTTQELQHALAVDIYDYQSDCFDPDNITDIDFIRSACAGLVTVDKIVGVIRLVHHTAQQYFDQTRAEYFPKADWQIATTCLQYLCYRNVSTEPLLSRDDYRKRLQQWPLYGYASEHWHEHIDTSKRQSDIDNFLKNTHACAGTYQTAVISKYTQYEGSDYYFVSWDFALGSACSMALHWAAFVGHENIARELLQGGCDVNQEDFEGMTPLMVASRQGHSGIVRMLLREWHAEATTSEQGKSALLYATTFNQEKVVRVLLEHSHVDNAGSAPLGQAIALGYIGVVKLLLSDPRVNPYVALPDGKSGLTIAASSGFSGIVDLLLSKNDLEVKERGTMALTAALQKGHKAIARRILDDQRIYAGLDNVQGLAMIHSVVGSGNVDLLSALVRNLDIASSSIIERGKTTPLVLAVQTGQLHIVRSLLKSSNVNIDAKDELGRTALSWAAEAGAGHILHTLLAVDGIDTEVRDNKGWPPLFYAAAGTCEETVSALLKVGRVPVDTLGPFGTTPLFHVKETGIAQILLDAGADCNWRNAKGVTPLMHMYHEGHEQHAVLELLCQRGADLHSLGENGNTILLRAAKRGDAWMVNLLLKNGAGVDEPGKHGGSILLSALEHAPKAVSDDFIGVCARQNAVFGFDKGLATDPKAKAMDYANKAQRYRAVIGLLLRWGAEKESLSQLDLLKLKSKKGAL